jgi:hypothetical protein
MRFFAMVDLVKKKSEIVLHIREVTSVLCLFEVVACGGVFNQRAIQVISWAIGVQRFSSTSAAV